MVATDQSAALDALALQAKGLQVRYRVYDESGRSLRRFVARGLRPSRYREILAVRGVDIELRRGEALGVIGRNGSGKSTLLRALAGLIPPDEGEVLARTTPVLLGVGSVLQSDISCRRNVQIGATALGVPRADARRRTDEVLAFAGVEDFADLPFRSLSSGMRARLQFAIATSVTPDILMVDETLAVGDADFRRKSEAHVKRLVDGAGSFVLVSHSMKMVYNMCSRVIWIDGGRVRRDGDPLEVIRAYEAASS